MRDYLILYQPLFLYKPTTSPRESLSILRGSRGVPSLIGKRKLWMAPFPSFIQQSMSSAALYRHGFSSNRPSAGLYSRNGDSFEIPPAPSPPAGTPPRSSNREIRRNGVTTLEQQRLLVTSLGGRKAASQANEGARRSGGG